MHNLIHIGIVTCGNAAFLRRKNGEVGKTSPLYKDVKSLCLKFSIEPFEKGSRGAGEPEPRSKCGESPQSRYRGIHKTGAEQHLSGAR